MSGFFNSFYYGKAGKADYTPEQLPTNRVQLFFEMLRIRFSGIVGMNLLYVLAMLPSIVWTVVTLMVINNEVEMALAAAGTVDLATANINFDLIMGYISTYLIGMIPCMAISGIIKPGVIYVLRNWSRDQHSFIWSDLKDAIKDNWKQGLLTGFLNGLSLFIAYVCWRFYSIQAATNVFWTIPQALVVILCAMWWMANMLIFPMMVTYKMKYSQIIRNCFIMVIARLPWSILIWGLSVAIPAVLLFVPYGTIIDVVVYLIAGFGITFFIYTSYANSCFDRFLNPRIEGAPVNMGLRDPAYDDEDDDEEAGEPEKK